MLAYIAGLMDGEGCITRTNGRPIVQVGMTDEAVIRWLHGFGGNLNISMPRPPRKMLYRWRVLAQRDVLILLWAICPYMRTKRIAAEEAILEIWGRMLIAEDELLALELVA